jgi:hypothetical protein
VTDALVTLLCDECSEIRTVRMKPGRTIPDIRHTEYGHTVAEASSLYDRFPAMTKLLTDTRIVRNLPAQTITHGPYATQRKHKRPKHGRFWSAPSLKGKGRG